MKNTAGSELIITVSGLRGIVGQSLTPGVALRYSCAFAEGLGEGPIVITRDGRTTGRMLADVIRGGLCALGRRVIDADLAATPTTGVLIRHLGAAGGIQISASHNPAPYNGLKLFSHEGMVLTAAAGESVTGRFREGEIGWVTHESIGEVVHCTDTVSQHVALVLGTVDVERIRRARFKVFLDTNHSASGLVGQRLLADLGCRVTHVGAEPTGCFTRLPEPTLENLAGAARQVAASGADIGFFPDPDGDRLAVVDETGRYVGEEFTVALCIDHVLREDRGPVVVNAATSRMVEDIAQTHGVPFLRARVGEANVVELMRSHRAVLGGEGNGGVIDPRVGYVRDSFLAMALILDAAASRGAKVSQLVDGLPRYHIHKTTLAFDRSKLKLAIEALRRLFSDAEFDESVGIRFNWPSKWLLLHPSNTEPIVRLIAESPARADSEKLARTAAQALQGL